MLKDAQIKNNMTVRDMISNGNWRWPAEWMDKIPALGMITVPTLNEN